MYDYIIVGAGSAGCVLANRLSANPDHRVLLLEAGPDDDSFVVRMPFGAVLLMKDRKRNWLYDTEAEPQLNHRKLFWPRGKTLGGSSAVNAMVYIRGQREDYDAWAAAGNEGWSYDDLLPHFKACENNFRGADDFHGSDGELAVMDIPDPHPRTNDFVKAGVQAGYIENHDFNGPSQEGVGHFQVTQKDHQRCSAAHAFLHPIMGTRPNLTVMTGALVHRVILEDGRAKGVVYSLKGQQKEAHCSAEVILCGGAINSPQLLMLSGIGDAKELSQHGIEAKHPLEGVGKNLQDHLDYIVTQRVRTGTSVGIALSALPFWIKAVWQYLTGKRGTLSSNFAEAGGFVRSHPDIERPDLQFHFVPTWLENHGRDLKYGYGISLHVCHLRPQSRGQLRLRSANPNDTVKIEAGYLTHEGDLEALKAGIHAARKILKQDAFAAIRGTEIWPGEGVQSDTEIEATLRSRAETVYHPVGTCKMGRRDDPSAVVDGRLRVHGIEGLRVADASIMPTVVSGNTNAPCMMIGHKAAEMVLSDREA